MQEVGLVMGDVARALALEPVVVDAVAVDVAGVDAVAVRVGPVVAQVDHRADVGVAAAGLAVLRVALALARVGPVAAGPVDVVGAGLDQAVGVRVEVLAEHPLEVRAGDDVEQVRDHAVGDERLAVVVEVEAPGVRRAVGDGLEDLPGGVIPPDAAVDRHAVVVGRARLADPRVRQDAVAALEPAVGPHFRPLNMLCWALMSQPSSTTSAGPSGLSSPSRSGMNSRLGVAQTQTPPKPSSMPVKFVPLS